MSLMLVAILAFFVLLSLMAGTLLLLKPALAIDIQKKFYALINWSIEPISMPKELRNTKIMGLLLVFISLVTGFLIVWQIRK